MNLKSLLEYKNKSVLFVGIGNVLRSDDGVGVYISKKLKKRENIKIITVEVSIENYIGKINNFQSDIIVLIDSVNFNREPGYYNLASVNELIDFTTNTHNISLKNISALFKGEVKILGIQPESIELGENLTFRIKKTADKIITLINDY